MAQAGLQQQHAEAERAMPADAAGEEAAKASGSVTSSMPSNATSGRRAAARLPVASSRRAGPSSVAVRAAGEAWRRRTSGPRRNAVIRAAISSAPAAASSLREPGAIDRLALRPGLVCACRARDARRRRAPVVARRRYSSCARLGRPGSRKRAAARRRMARAAPCSGCDRAGRPDRGPVPLRSGLPATGPRRPARSRAALRTGLPLLPNRGYGTAAALSGPKASRSARCQR